jgi:uridine phosphorylase
MFGCLCDNLRNLRNQFFSRSTAASVLVILLLVCVGSTAAAQEPVSPPIALIGIPSEIAPVESRVQNAVTRRIQGFVFTSGTIEGARVVVARSGVGKVNAAVVATLLVEHFTPSVVLFTGTAGALDTKLNPGDVVIGIGVGYHDFGVLRNAVSREAPRVTRSLVSLTRPFSRPIRNF